MTRFDEDGTATGGTVVLPVVWTPVAGLVFAVALSPDTGILDDSPPEAVGAGWTDCTIVAHDVAIDGLLFVASLLDYSQFVMAELVF